MSFVSTAEFSPNEKIVIRSTAGPFTHLDLYWTFSPVERGCLVTLVIDAVYRSRLLGGVSDQILESLAQRMLRAFERRANVLYGASTADS
jgi:coenzyme Q-binding protein COQ10